MTWDDWRTLDGLPISSSRPYGAMVVVHRPSPGGREFLVLHRAGRGPDHEGDWAWTPPSGARLPGERVTRCARRELLEETGLELPLRRILTASEDWAVFVAEASSSDLVVLDAEHDRFALVAAEDLLLRCAPARVADQIREAIAFIDTGTAGRRAGQDDSLDQNT